jgi:hypothetical protein
MHSGDESKAEGLRTNKINMRSQASRPTNTDQKELRHLAAQPQRSAAPHSLTAQPT